MAFLKTNHTQLADCTHRVLPLVARQHSAQPRHPSPNPLAAAARHRIRACAGGIKGVPHTAHNPFRVTCRRCAPVATGRALPWPENPKHPLCCDLGLVHFPTHPDCCGKWLCDSQNWTFYVMVVSREFTGWAAWQPQ